MSDGRGTAKAVLAKCAAYDPTFPKPDAIIVDAWAEVIGWLDRDDALAVVARHYAAETRRIMPADVLAGVKAIRKDRLDRTIESVPDVDPDNVTAYLSLVREGRRETAAMGNPAGAAEVRRMVEPAFKRVGGSK